MPPSDDLDRLRAEYLRRAATQNYQTLYSALNPANLHIVQARERAVMALLRRQGLTDLAAYRLLDVGCGQGGELLRWLGYGCQPAHCAGIDVLTNRVTSARARLPSGVGLQTGDASHLPYPDASFDLITQFTVFSSVLDADLRRAIAAEMLRVLRPEGMIIWYDFWLNPGNRQTRGVRLPEIQALFPHCHYDARRITLAPPLARRVAPVSTVLADLLAWLPLRTHWLVGIRKQ